MSKIFDMELFNAGVKEQFLSGYSVASQEAFKRVLKRSSIMESQLQKDLYDFSKDEIKDVLFLLNPNKITTSKSNGNAIRSYINWAIEAGYRNSTINPLANMATEWYEQFVDKSKRTVFSKDEIDRCIEFLQNDQDKAVIIGLFEGIRPEEMLNIQPLKDIDEESGMIRLYSSKYGEREKQFSERLIAIFMRAFRQDRYLKSNGDVSSALIAASETHLIDTGFLLKLSNTSKNGGKPDSSLFYRKLRIIQNYDEEFKYLNPVNLKNSGMLYLAYTIYKRDGALGTRQLDEVCYEYDIATYTAYVSKRRGEAVQNYKRSQLVADFLNVETITKLYSNS